MIRSWKLQHFGELRVLEALGMWFMAPGFKTCFKKSREQEL